MAGKYNPAKKFGIERFPRYAKPKWRLSLGKAALSCGCGGVVFRIEKLPMKRQRHTMTAKHRQIVAKCVNPKCGGSKKIR